MVNIKIQFPPLLLIGLGVGILFLPGLRTFYKYLPLPALLWVTFLLAECAVLFALFSKRYFRLLVWLTNPYFIFTVFLRSLSMNTMEGQEWLPDRRWPQNPNARL